MATETPQKTTITDAQPSIEATNHQMIVDKTLSIDGGNNLAQTPKGETDNQSAQYSDLDLSQSKSKAP
eukprot:8245376-Ditylum_brightwellii.AAC.1